MSDVVRNVADYAEPRIRTLTVADLREALWQGFDDFRAIPTQLVFIGLLYPVVALVAARAAAGDLLPLLFPLLTGVSLMGPVVAVGLYEISRQRERGGPVSSAAAFDVLRSPAIGSLAFMTVLLLLIFAIWVGVAQAIYVSTMGKVVPDGIGAFAQSVLETGGGHRLIVWGNLVGAGFAAVVLAISVVSLPMLLDRNCGVVTAVRTSVRAVWRNPGVMGV
ncbi:MAG: DUF2189 domain-containing protein, partial [Acetobacteraceae bacterium]|nr:DUF2189 domain-containing protein [Acetobacteraceae bacterium]